MLRLWNETFPILFLCEERKYDEHSGNKNNGQDSTYIFI